MKERFFDYRHIQSIRTHKTRMQGDLARAYTAHLKQCQQAYQDTECRSAELQGAIRTFQDKGFTTLWTSENHALAASILQKVQAEEQRGEKIWDEELRYAREIYATFPEIEQLFRGSLGLFLHGIYRAHFKIFYGILYKSEQRVDRPSGSQLWHDDGGPGTCINVMFYLKDVAKEDGAMECLPWDAAFEIYKKELLEHAIQRKLDELKAQGLSVSKEQARDARCQYYLDEITRAYADRVEQPSGRAGLLLPFRNNSVHKGGFPEPGRTRYVCVFHCYPSDRPTPFERYRRLGIPKRGSLPKDPAEDF